MYQLVPKLHCSLSHAYTEWNLETLSFHASIQIQPNIPGHTHKTCCFKCISCSVCPPPCVQSLVNRPRMCGCNAGVCLYWWILMCLKCLVSIRVYYRYQDTRLLSLFLWQQCLPVAASVISHTFTQIPEWHLQHCRGTVRPLNINLFHMELLT